MMSDSGDLGAVRHRHLRIGWWAFALFLALGVVLEGLHGFKAAAYLDVENSSRRLMWTLAHAHGTLLGLVNVAFAFTVAQLPGWSPSARRLASRCLVAGTVLLPGGFFLGGIVVYGGDPGLGIALVALGGLLLLLAAVVTARATAGGSVTEPDPPAGGGGKPKKGKKGKK